MTPMGNPDQWLVHRFLAAPHQPLAADTHPLARDLAMVLRAWDGQRRELTLTFRTAAHHLQGNGVVQGGIVSTMLDFSLVFPVLGLLAPPKGAVTVSLNLHFERPVAAGELVAVARVDRLGGRMAFGSAELKDARQTQTLARATAVMAVV